MILSSQVLINVWWNIQYWSILRVVIPFSLKFNEHYGENWSVYCICKIRCVYLVHRNIILPIYLSFSLSLFFLSLYVSLSLCLSLVDFSFSLSLSVSLSLSFCLSLCLSLVVFSFCLSLFISLHVSLSLSFYLCVSVSLHLCISASLSLYLLCLSFSVSFRLKTICTMYHCTYWNIAKYFYLPLFFLYIKRAFS